MRLPMDTFDQVRGESDSLEGWYWNLPANFPAVNAVIVTGDFNFTVMQTDHNRIQLVRITVESKGELIKV